MFERNLKVLELKNPLLAKKLREIPLGNIEVFRSISEDINIAYKNIALHSEENPISEAEQLFAPKIEYDSPHSIFIIYGLGLGYLFKRAFISVKGKIIVFEPFIEILRFTLEYVDFSKELLSENVYFCTSIEEITPILNEKYLIGDMIDVNFLPSYLQLDSISINKLTDRIISFIKTKQLDQNTILNRSIEWVTSSMNNIDEIIKTPSIDIFENNFSDLPVVIASAGPTLEENLELLKENRNKFILIVVNTALRALLNNDIIPDFCVITESLNIDYQFKGLNNLDKVNYILHPRAPRFLWELKAEKFLYLTNTDGFSQWLNSKINNELKLWPSAGTVSLISFYVATKIFNSKKIILVGQDLAFVDDKVYADSAMIGIKDIKIQDEKLIAHIPNLTVEREYCNLETVWVNNSQGEKILTGRDYCEYIYQYEDIIKNELSEETKVFNSSLKGAYIQGMIYQPLKNILSELTLLDRSITEEIKRISFANESKTKEYEKKLTPQIREFFEKVKAMLTRCPHLLRFIENYNKKLTEDASEQILNFLVASYFEYKNELATFIYNENVLSSMLQKAQYYYIKRYIKEKENTPPTKEEVSSNMYAEKLLIESIYDMLTEIDKIKFLEMKIS